MSDTTPRTATDPDADADLPEPGHGSDGQTYLIGETLYLRGLELGDAAHTSAWRDSLFPIPAEHAEELLKEEVPNERRDQTYRLIALRRSDDAPVGSVTYQLWDGRVADFVVRAYPAFNDAARTAIKTELLRLMVPWLLHERDLMAIWFTVDSTEPDLMIAATDLGMSPASRLREAIWRNGARADEWTFEALHPVWLARLGDPATDGQAGPEGATARAIALAPKALSPARRPVNVTGDPPPNAVLIGERIYLRPVEVSDAEDIARWSRQETETFFDQGRRIISPISYAHNSRKLAEDDPPERIRFAIVLRDGDELIGSNGIDEINWIHRTAETYTVIERPEYRGQGLGTEAKHLLLAYAFEHLGLHAVRSYVWAPNTRSAAALRKQGYRDAGRFHWTGIKHAEFVHDLLFDLLADEWRTAREP